MDIQKQNLWDERYLSLSEEVSSWSKDPSTKVGCVIIDDYGRPVSFGYNGFAKGVDDSGARLQNREVKLKYTIHAENNAILSSSKQLDGCTVYITHPPCIHCLSQMKQCRIVRVVCPKPSADFSSRWDVSEIVDFARELGITLEIKNLGNGDIGG